MKKPSQAQKPNTPPNLDGFEAHTQPQLDQLGKKFDPGISSQKSIKVPSGALVSLQEVKTPSAYDRGGKIFKYITLLQNTMITTQQKSLKELAKDRLNFRWSILNCELRLAHQLSERIIEAITAEMSAIKFAKGNHKKILDSIKSSTIPSFIQFTSDYLAHINFLIIDNDQEEHNIQAFVSSPDKTGQVVATADYAISGIKNFLQEFNSTCEHIVNAMQSNASGLIQARKLLRTQFQHVALSEIARLPKDPKGKLEQLIAEGTPRLEGLKKAFNSTAPTSFFSHNGAQTQTGMQTTSKSNQEGLLIIADNRNGAFNYLLEEKTTDHAPGKETKKESIPEKKGGLAPGK